MDFIRSKKINQRRKTKEGGLLLEPIEVLQKTKH
jgi:hypothetical protein